MTKQEHIQYWILTAEKDWEVVNALFRDGNYLYSLYFAHLTMEKLLKAHWVKDNNDNYPVRTHNLIKLAECTTLAFSEDDLVFLERLNDFQLEGRYPDYQLKIYQTCTKKFTEPILERVQAIRTLLIGKL